MRETSQRAEEPTGLHLFTEKQKRNHKGACPSESGSFRGMPLAPEEGQKMLFEQRECQFHWTPPPASAII